MLVVTAEYEVFRCGENSTQARARVSPFIAGTFSCRLLKGALDDHLKELVIVAVITGRRPLVSDCTWAPGLLA
jgi:hypothetical protein